MFRTLYGDHQRYEDVYFNKFKGFYCTGDGKFIINEPVSHLIDKHKHKHSICKTQSKDKGTLTWLVPHHRTLGQGSYVP